MLRFLLGIIVFMGTTSVSAQRLINYGFKAGPTLSSFNSPPVDGFVFPDQRRTGVAVFGFASTKVSRFLSVGAEIGYTQRGSKIETELRDSENRVIGFDWIHDRIDYVSVAPIVSAGTQNYKVNPFLAVGPRIDVKIGGSPNDRGSLSDSFARTATGFMIGSGIVYQVATDAKVRFEARINKDFTDSLPQFAREAKNRAIDFLIGIEF